MKIVNVLIFMFLSSINFVKAAEHNLRKIRFNLTNGQEVSYDLNQFGDNGKLIDIKNKLAENIGQKDSTDILLYLVNPGGALSLYNNDAPINAFYNDARGESLLVLFDKGGESFSAEVE